MTCLMLRYLHVARPVTQAACGYQVSRLAAARNGVPAGWPHIMRSCIASSSPLHSD